MRRKFLLSWFLMLLLITGNYSILNAQVAKIGETSYDNFASALSAAGGMTGDVTVDIYEKVTLNTSLSGNYSSINFVGKDTDAEIYLDVQGYITATGKKVAFEDLTLSKSAGGFLTNAGFMNVAFGVYDVTEVTYTGCNFANGAYASSGKVTYNDCTFKRSHDKYGLWAYGNVDVTVDDCIFADYRGIKMYAEGAAKTVDLTVKNTDFSAVDDKPAIVLTYGERVTLEGNTYSDTGTFELDLDGQPNGTAVTSDVAPTCQNDNGACGVLCDGKIYTTVAQAAAVATAGSTVTLLHNSTETVELPEGVLLDTNGHTASNVTGGITPITDFASLKTALQQAGSYALMNNITVTEQINISQGTIVTLDLNGHKITASDKIYPINNDGILTINDSGEGGTIEGLGIRTGYTVNRSAFAELTINGGIFRNVYPEGAALYVHNGTVIINGGKFYGQNIAIANHGGNINAKDCYIDGYNYAIEAVSLTKINNATISGVCVINEYIAATNVTFYEARIGEAANYTSYRTLAEAVQAAESGDVVQIIKEGSYDLPEFREKTLTFEGVTLDKTKTSIKDYVNKGSQGMTGSTVNFKNLTINGANGNYNGLFHTTGVTYENCDIYGLRFLYSPTTFTNCAFNAAGVEHSFWTYGASNVTVTGCTFTYTDRAVNCYSENGANHELDITFSDCDFVYAGSSDKPAGAVEINSSSVKSMDVAFTNDCTAPEKGEMWYISSYDTDGGDNTIVKVNGETVFEVLPVAKIGDVDYKKLQKAIDAAQNDETITLLRDCGENVTITQKADVKFTIDGAQQTMTGAITVDGKSATIMSAGVTIKKVKFNANDITTDAAINLGVKGDNNTRYTCNVTVDNCTFTGTGQTKAAVKSYTGGDKNLTITNCTVDATMHSLAQLINVDGVVIDNCTVNSKNGINLNSSANVVVKNSKFEVGGYPVRIGVDGGTSGKVELTNNTLKTDNSEGDAAIVIRGTASTQVELTMTKNIVSGTTHISGTTEATNISADANYWGEGLTGPVVDGTNVDVNSYYADEALEQLIVTALTLQQFVEKVTEGSGTYNGTFTEGGVQKNITVKVVPVSGDARTTDDVRVPNRLQKYTNPEVYYAQYQRFSELTDVNISNVNFVFYPAAVTVTDAWNTAGATTTADNINGELQLLNTGSVSFANCSFEKMSVSPINAATLSVTSSEFNGLDAYAIKDIKATTATIAGTTFTDCNGGFWFNNAPTTLTVTDNTFTGTGRRGAIQFSANGDYANTEMTVTGNEVKDEAAFLWQLNNTISNAQLNAILDKNNNTYETAFVAGSVELHLQGEGTAESPYLINDISDLEFFRDDVNGGNTYAGKYIKLTAGIDLNNEEWTPIGNNTNKFQGYFDGNNKTISNLKVTGNTNHKGFFGYIKGTAMSATTTPSVKDLTLENVNVSGNYYVGGLSGQAYTCNITNVTVKGNVSGVRYVGGLVGHVYTYFKDCHFIGNASCSLDALGGIAGAGDCRAYDCSVIGDVTGSNWVGGIIGNGQEGTSAVGCYVKGDVKTSNNYYRGVGGIAGVAGHGYASSEFKNNYFDGEVYLEGEIVSAMIIGIVNANDNESIGTTVEGNSWNTDYYDVNTPVYVVAEISSPDASLEDWIDGASDELTKPRNNNLVMLKSDIQYVEATDIDDVTIMKFSEVTVDEILPQIEENNQVAYIDSNADGAYNEGETKYTSLQEAYIAATDGQTITLLKNITLGEKFVIERSITLDGNGKTLTYTGTDRAIDVPNNANANIDVTIKNLDVVATAANRGINYNENGTLNVDNVTVTIGENVDGYAINFPGMADNAQVTIKDSKLTSRNPLNIWGENMVINVYDSEIISVENSTTYDYAAIQLNNDNYGNVANGTVVNVYRGKITALNDNDEPSNVVANATETGVVNISDETIVTGKVLDYVANIGGVYFGSLQAAVNAIEEYGYNSPIVIMKSFATSETATVKNGLNVTIDLNGKTITVTDNTTKNFEAIKNQGTLTIKDSSADKTGKITVTATTNSGWNRYSAVIANTVGGKLIVESGTLEHLGGTDMAYGIDNLTNGKGTYAETVINGGYIKSPYRGIRQFLNGIEADNILTVNGGTIEGVNKSIWMQDPNKNANTGTLTVGESASLKGDVYLFVTEGSTSWPVTVSIAAAAVAEGSEVMTANLPVGVDVQNINGTYGVVNVVAQIDGTYYQTFEAALNAVQDGKTITVLNVEGSEDKELEFTKDIEFTITGEAPNYALPVVTFQNATVNISNAEILIPELDARQNATINVISSTVYDAGGDGIVKSYYNGAIYIDANSTVYTMQVTTMGYITVAGTLKATWQTNVYGNGLITLNKGATFNTAALHLTGQDYSNRDNTDADRVGKPAEIVVDDANFTIGKVLSAGGADYSYNSSKGINVGTVEGKSAILNIKNGGNVNIYMANGETANIGAGGTVNIAASTLNTFCRAENGTVTLANNGTVYVTGEANLDANVTGNGWFYMNGVALDADTKLLGAKVGFINGENNIVASTIKDGWFSVGIGKDTDAETAAAFATANGITLGNVTVNVSDNATVYTSTDAAYSGWVGSAYSADKGLNKYILNINSSLARFGYMHVSKDGEMNVTGQTNNEYESVDFYAGTFINNGNVTLNGVDAWAQYTKISVDHADAVLNITNGTKYEANCTTGNVNDNTFLYYNAGTVNIDETSSVNIEKATKLVEGAVLNIASNNVIAKGELTNNGTINFTSETATLTVPTTGLTVNNETGNNDIKVVYENGTYKFIDKHYVAEIVGGAKYESLAEAVTAAQDGQTIELIYAEGDAPIEMAASLYGKSVTIKGTATVDWSKGFLFVGRGGVGNATLIFDGANLTSASNNATYGIHVSGREKGTDNKYDGTVKIKNSTIELDYLINKGTMTLDNSTLTVKNGFAVGGRPASETESGADATATMTLNNGSKVVVNNHNGMGLGYEAIGVMDINSGSTFETTQNFLITAKGTMNVDETSKIVNTNNSWINNKGVIKFNGSTLKDNYIDSKGVTEFAGTIKFEGNNSVITDNIEGSPFELIVNKGATLLISRFVLGYERAITVYGEIANAHEFNPEGKIPSLKFNNPSGVSVGGTDTGRLTAKDAYLEFDNSSWKNSEAEHIWSFENCYVSATSFGNNNAQGSTTSTWNVTFNSSVLAAKNYIKNGVGVTYNFTNGSVATTGSLRIDGTLNVDANSSVTTTEQQNNVQNAVDEHGGINGTINIAGTLTIGSNAATQLEVLGGEVNVNGGTINLGDNTLTLDEDSKLRSYGNIYGAITAAAGADIELTGGIYTQDVNNFCHADYDAIAMGDGKWIVVQVSGTQTRELPDAGWYWFSTYITYNNEETALDKLQAALGSNASLIKGQNAFTQYLNYNGTNFWTSDLTTLSTAKMYMIKTKADNVTVNLTGSFEDYANTNIELKQGWNWIGYPINEAVSLNDAIPTEALKDGDIIKDQTSSARYYVNFELPNGNTFTGWDGSLTEMKPGQGYMFKSVNEKTFSYTTSSNGARSTLNTVDYNGDNHWFTDATQYPNNMNIVAMMSIDGEIVKGNYEVAAFANGECRGSARPIYIEALDAYVWYMTIHGEDVAELTFKYYDVNYGTEYELDNRLTYSSDAILGSLKDPYIFTMNILGIGENSIDNINIYPNPTTTDREINLQAMCDKVEVFNALGVKVAEYTNVDSIDAIETAGIYVIRVTIDGNARNCRLVVR